jgi:hypothetical protein
MVGKAEASLLRAGMWSRWNGGRLDLRPGRRALLAVGLVWVGSLAAGAIHVPNASFESPAASFPEINIESWRKTPKPADYDESGGFLWTQLTGLFRNVAPGNEAHIENCDGAQAAWLFAVPGVGLFQEGSSTPGGGEEFAGRFEPSRSYRLTVGVIGGGYGMWSGATLQVSFFFRDSEGAIVTVAETTIAHDPALFGIPKRLVDVTARVPRVDSGDPWAGQGMGIMLLSTVSSDLQGGLWELDNVRLGEYAEPTLVASAVTDGVFTVELEGETGVVYELLASNDLAAPLAEWALVGAATNVTGRVVFSDDETDAARRFYTVRERAGER